MSEQIENDQLETKEWLDSIDAVWMRLVLSELMKF